MDPNKGSLTKEELWKALYESDSHIEANCLDVSCSEDEDNLLPDDHIEDEFDPRESQNEADGDVSR